MQRVAVNKDNKGYFCLDVCLCKRFQAFVARYQDIISTQPRLMWANRSIVNYRVKETLLLIIYTDIEGAQVSVLPECPS